VEKGATLAESRVREDAPDPLAGLIEQLADGPARASAARSDWATGWIIPETGKRSF
jgi:hypothetical protein